MIGNVPNIPGGTDPESIWKRSVEERLRALRIQSVPGAIVQRTSGRGVAIIPKPQAAPSGPSSPSVKVSMFKLKQIFADYLKCVPWNGTAEVPATGPPGTIEASGFVFVAKPDKLRNSVLSAILDLIPVTYTYSDTTVRRVAKTDSDSEIQIVLPRYLIEDVIYAAEVKGGDVGVRIGATGIIIKWIDLNVAGRVWARKFNQAATLLP